MRTGIEAAETGTAAWRAGAPLRRMDRRANPWGRRLAASVAVHGLVAAVLVIVPGLRSPPPPPVTLSVTWMTQAAPPAPDASPAAEPNPATQPEPAAEAAPPEATPPDPATTAEPPSEPAPPEPQPSPPAAEPPPPDRTPPPAESPPSAREEPPPEPIPAREQAPDEPPPSIEPPLPQPPPPELPPPESPPVAAKHPPPPAPPPPPPAPPPPAPARAPLRPRHVSAPPAVRQSASSAPSPLAEAAAAPPQPAEPTPPAAAPPRVDAGWQGAVAAWLQRHKAYPAAARARAESGGVTMRFSVDRAGQVSDVAVLRGSGSQTLDEAARALVAGARLPPFPADMAVDRVTISVRLTYALTR